MWKSGNNIRQSSLPILPLGIDQYCRTACSEGCISLILFYARLLHVIFESGNSGLIQMRFKWDGRNLSRISGSMLLHRHACPYGTCILQQGMEILLWCCCIGTFVLTVRASCNRAWKSLLSQHPFTSPLIPQCTEKDKA